MKDIFLLKGFKSFDVNPPERKIAVQTGRPTVPAAATPDRASYRQPFANEQRNSRIGRPLPAGSWELRWQAKLTGHFAPFFVLDADDRVVVDVPDLQIFDLEGALVASPKDRATAGPMLADPASGYLYRLHPSGYFRASRLSDDGEVYRFLPNQGDVFRRTLIARSGKRILLAAVERALDPHRHRKPSRSMIEVMEVGQPIRTRGPGFLASGRSIGSLQIASPELVCAASPQLIAGALPGRIYLATWDLDVFAVLRGEFTPEELSMDEAGRLYLIVRTGKGPAALWLLDQEGHRLYSNALDASMTRFPIPPVVGYDHTAYIVAGQRITAISPDGRMSWSHPASGRIAGAVVTSDGQLLASEGRSVVAWDREGASRTLISLPETLDTPPILTGSGELLVASTKSLFCARAR